MIQVLGPKVFLLEGILIREKYLNPMDPCWDNHTFVTPGCYEYLKTKGKKQVHVAGCVKQETTESFQIMLLKQNCLVSNIKAQTWGLSQFF